MTNVYRLTKRQHQVAQLLFDDQELTQRQIASRLGIAPGTVAGYVNDLYTLLGARTRLGAYKQYVRLDTATVDG